jgi:hypothetical protein
MLIDKINSVDLYLRRGSSIGTALDRQSVPLTNSFLPKPNAAVKRTHSTIVRRDLGLVRQMGAPDEMVFISATSSDLSQYGGNYTYHESAGSGQKVYIIDSGASLGSEVCMNICSPTVLLNGSTGIQEYRPSGKMDIRRGGAGQHSKRW